MQLEAEIEIYSTSWSNVSKWFAQAYLKIHPVET